MLLYLDIGRRLMLKIRFFLVLTLFSKLFFVLSYSFVYINYVLVLQVLKVSFNLSRTKQLYERSALDENTELHLTNVTSLPPHPNVGGVCSHFSCRLPRSLLSRSSRGGAADVVCVVLATRPSENVEVW